VADAKEDGEDKKAEDGEDEKLDEAEAQYDKLLSRASTTSAQGSGPLSQASTKRTSQASTTSFYDKRTSHNSLSAASAVGWRDEAEDGQDKKLKSVALEAKEDKKLKSVGKEAEDALEALALEALAEPLEQHVAGDKQAVMLVSGCLSPATGDKQPVMTPVSPLHCQFLRFY
jgi:hypothetical protein